MAAMSGKVEGCHVGDGTGHGYRTFLQEIFNYMHMAVPGSTACTNTCVCMHVCVLWEMRKEDAKELEVI